MKLVWAIVLGFMVAGCETVTEIEKPDETAAVVQGVYTIGVGDQLNISVWKNPELSASLPVRPDGFISVPLLGDIKAEGKKPQQLSSDIQNRLKNYIKSPQVTVVLKQAVSSEFLHRVRITGAVESPASLAHQKGMTVMDVVLLTGGLTEFAKGNQTKLYRNTVNGTKVYTVRLNDILEKGDIETNFRLYPGDIITVPDSLF